MVWALVLVAYWRRVGGVLVAYWWRVGGALVRGLVVGRCNNVQVGTG